MQVQITQHSDAAKGKSIEISDQVFNINYNESLVHQIVTAYMSAGRAGTKSNKSRREVRGGGIKPWRQKGSGRARAGTIRSPLWRGGGVTFAAKNRNYQQKINRKMYTAGMRSILAELLRQERMIVVDDFTVTSPKTRELITKIDQFNINNVLIISHDLSNELMLAARNIPGIEVLKSNDIDPVSLLKHEHILITIDALKQIEEKLS